MPRPVIPDYADRHTCRALGCKKEATQACSRCKGGSRNSYYCSRECQNDVRPYRWQTTKACSHSTHRTGFFTNNSVESMQDRSECLYISHFHPITRKVYTFKIELLGSQDPVITRIVDVPAWYTFEELHFVVQYAFGPWQQCHLHEFSYRTTKSNRTGTISLKPLGEILRIVMADDEDDGFSFPGLPGLPSVPKMFEKNVKLKDIYDPSGRLREKVLDGDGHVLPLTYVYDFGVSCFFSLPYALVMQISFMIRTTGSIVLRSKARKWHLQRDHCSSQLPVRQ